MPWKRVSPQRILKFYKDGLMELNSKEQANPDMAVKSLMMRSEILKHDFTKRQMSILLFIYTFSYAFAKEEANIPKLSDFSLVGIAPSKIKPELQKLENMGVIIWDRESNVFKLNDFRDWHDAPYVSTYNDTRAKELYLLNLEEAGVDVKSMMDQLYSEI
ncbi:replication protein [Bacillus xiapuensis]|uniref:Replication protein n=1 Tax=Bacillus xiapuensis TaxID=2014075 RepID=A0ABU6N8I0_9BACI|nr:replication protein [Bacillus xiapuensis]